jgi:hypothetical protein
MQTIQIKKGIEIGFEDPNFQMALAFQKRIHFAVEPLFIKLIF